MIKKLLVLSVILLSKLGYSQLSDGVYKFSKITVSGGLITAIDSALETDPTVDVAVKGISNTDQDHWNCGYNACLRGDPAGIYVSLTGNYNNPQWIYNFDLARIQWSGSANQYINGLGAYTAFPTQSLSISGQTVSIKNGTTTINSITIPTQTTALTSSQVTTALGFIPSSYNYVTNTATRTIVLGTAYQPNTTKDVDVRVNVSIACNLSLSGGQSGTIDLQISANGTSGWITKRTFSNSNTGTLTIGLNTTQTSGGELSCIVPTGWYYRANSGGTGTFSVLNPSDEITH